LFPIISKKESYQSGMLCLFGSWIKRCGHVSGMKIFPNNLFFRSYLQTALYSGGIQSHDPHAAISACRDYSNRPRRQGDCLVLSGFISFQGAARQNVDFQNDDCQNVDKFN
jgi:hypothetical protein